MTAEDSLLNSQAHFVNMDCYDQSDTRKLFLNYSNGQESCVIYNLSDKDSIVNYFYSGNIASIGLYYGCLLDTIWTTTYIDFSKSKRPIINSNDGIVIVDGVEYYELTTFTISYSPVYEIILYNEEGKLVEKIKNGNSFFTDFKSIKREKYKKP